MREQGMDQLHEPPTTSSSISAQPNESVKWMEIDPGIQDLDEVASRYLSYKVAEMINMVFSPIVFPIGFVGNILLLLVLLRRPQNHKASFTVYLSALAINDCLVLLLGITTWFTTVVFPFTALFCCKTKGIIFSSTTSIRICLIFFITLDRYLAACHPFRFLSWRTRRRAIQVTVMVIIICCLTAIPYALTSSIVNSFTCAGFLEGKTVSTVCCFIDIICFGVLPLSAVLVMNVTISRYTMMRHMQFSGLYGRRVVSASSQETKSTHMSEINCKNNITSNKNIHSRNHNGNTNICTQSRGQVKNKVCITRSTFRNIFSTISFHSQRHVSRNQSSIHINNNNDGNANCWNDKNSSHGDIVQNTSSHLPIQTVCNGALSGEAHTSRPASVRATDRQMARVLISITITLFVLVVPQLVRYVVFVFLDLRSSPATFAAYVLAYHISNKLCTANSAVNVFLYCVSGSQFRQELGQFLRLDSIKTWICKEKKETTYSQNNNSI